MTLSEALLRLRNCNISALHLVFLCTYPIEPTIPYRFNATLRS